MVRFRAKVAREGSKGGPKITVPSALAGELRAPGFIRVTVDAGEPYFVFARRPPSRTSVEFTPVVWRPELALGSEHDVTAEAAEPYRARADETNSGFDWLPFMPTGAGTEKGDYFPTEDGDELVLWNRYSVPFRLKRRPDEEATYWLLGLYQAEGSKSRGAAGGGRGLGAMDFSLANTNVRLLGAAVERLENAWMIPRERLSMEIIWPTGHDVATARGAFAALGVEIVAERESADHDRPAGTLHVRCSAPLMRMVRTVLHKIFATSFNAPMLAQAYAFAWLDGDATITISGPGDSIELRLAGYEAEQRVVFRALKERFGWDLTPGVFGAHDDFTSRILTLDQAADLAAAGAFPFSMNRARLIYTLDYRLARYVRKNSSLTTVNGAARARILFTDHLKEEARRLRMHPLAQRGFVTGKKGEPYPCLPY